MLLPNYTKDYLDGRYESIFTVNLFSELNLPVMFYVQQLGITVEKRNLPIHEKAQFHGEDKKFLNSKFTRFYKAMFPALIGVRWQAYEVTKWSREDWRISVACLLFGELAKYQRSKEIMTWQAECADIVSFYEALLSRKSNDNGHYRIGQKIEVLLGQYYKKELPGMRRDLGELFEARNDFVHGSFFDRLKKLTQTYPDNQDMAQLPIVDFHFLETQSRTAKQVLVTFLYLKKALSSGRFRNQMTVPEFIHSGIMDIKIRRIIQAHTKDILKLMPFRAVN